MTPRGVTKGDPLYDHAMDALREAGGTLVRGNTVVPVTALDGGTDWTLSLPMFGGPALTRLVHDGTPEAAIEYVELLVAR